MTYIGLYPSWLPGLKPSPSPAWDVQTYVRNISPNARNAINVSYFFSKDVTQQWRVTANKNGVSLIDDETIHSFSGLIVPNQGATALELLRFNGQPAGTTSISAFNGRGALGWERAGMTLYVPLIKVNWSGRRTQVYVTNTGNKATEISYRFYNQSGVAYPASETKTAQPNERVALSPWDQSPNLPAGVYAAVITTTPANDQPLAAVALEQNNTSPYSAPALYNAYSSGNTSLYAPLVKQNYSGNSSIITLQNVSNSVASFEARYYHMDGSQPLGATVTGSIPPYAPYVLYNPDEVDDGFVGAARITSTNGRPLVGVVSEAKNNGQDPRLIYNLALSGSTNVYLPLWYDNYSAAGGDWASGVNVHNTGAGDNQVTITWYRLDGTTYDAWRQTYVLAERATYTFYDPSQLDNFIGSAWIHSDSNKPIVAASNIHNWNATSGDSALSFTGSNR